MAKKRGLRQLLRNLLRKPKHLCTINNRKSTRGRIVQYVTNGPAKIFVESYTTKSGQKKNRYRINPDAYVLKKIVHNRI